MNAIANIQVEGLAKLRLAFPPNQVSKLPKPTKAQTEAVKTDFKKGIRCKDCGSWHHPEVVHLDYVGHAALTDRLLDTDPEWSWEPLALRDGLPAFDQSGGLWIKLTVCGVSRLGYGHAAAKPGIDPGVREKEVIGDALRNAAMRFGAALDLWHKGDLHAETSDDTPPNENGTVTQARQKTPPLTGPIKTRAEIRTACGNFVRDLQACADADMLDVVLLDNADLIEQVERECEFYWVGDGGDFKGMKREIELAKISFDDSWKTDVTRAG